MPGGNYKDEKFVIHNPADQAVTADPIPPQS